MDSTETIKLATMLLSLSKFLEFWMDHNYVQNFEKLYFSKGETISPTLLI